MNTVGILLAEPLRPALEGRLPAWATPCWVPARDSGPDPAAAAAQVAWLDGLDARRLHRTIAGAARLAWLNTQYVGLERFPVAQLRERNVLFTNGRGLNADAIAESALMGMLGIAKGYREIVLAQLSRQWLTDSPAVSTLHGTAALILGHGSIGQSIGRLLRAFGVDVQHVRKDSVGDPGCLGPAEWRHQLSRFDWVILAVPSTPQTRGMLGAQEFASMKKSAVVVNMARGDLIDQEALVDRLRDHALGGAVLDVTDPEPLPPEHILWRLPRVHITMHLSGKSEVGMREKAVRLFLDNLCRFKARTALLNGIDLARGY